MQTQVCPNSFLQHFLCASAGDEFIQCESLFHFWDFFWVDLGSQFLPLSISETLFHSLWLPVSDVTAARIPTFVSLQCVPINSSVFLAVWKCVLEFSAVSRFVIYPAWGSLRKLASAFFFFHYKVTIIPSNCWVLPHTKGTLFFGFLPHSPLWVVPCLLPQLRPVHTLVTQCCHACQGCPSCHHDCVS